MADTIGTWTSGQLLKFIQDMLRQFPPDFSPNLTSNKLTCVDLLNVSDQIQFNQVQTTVGAAGAASALPATPSGYIRILDYTGQPFVIPYYKAT